MKYWYALQNSKEDDWETGTFNKDEAIKKLKSGKCNIVAVIDNFDTNPYCIDEITLEDL